MIYYSYSLTNNMHVILSICVSSKFDRNTKTYCIQYYSYNCRLGVIVWNEKVFVTFTLSTFLIISEYGIEHWVAGEWKKQMMSLYICTFKFLPMGLLNYLKDNLEFESKLEV